jgi:hypothetical protein
VKNLKMTGMDIQGVGNVENTYKRSIRKKNVMRTRKIKPLGREKALRLVKAHEYPSKDFGEMEWFYRSPDRADFENNSNAHCKVCGNQIPAKKGYATFRTYPPNAYYGTENWICKDCYDYLLKEVPEFETGWQHDA